MTDEFDQEKFDKAVETLKESSQSIDDKFQNVLEILKETFGSDNIVVINTKEDITNLELELELRDYLRSGGRLN